MLLFLSILDAPEDRDKFEILYHTYKNLMFYVANDILRDTQDSEDVVHQAFLKIMEHIAKIGDPMCPKTKAFVVTIVERKAIDLYRCRQRHCEVMFDEEISLTEVPGPDEFLSRYTLSCTIAKLPPKYRQVLLLRYDQGFSEKEIADMLSMSRENVKKTLQRARKKLDLLLDREENSHK